MLLTPGPVPIPDFVMQAIAQPVIPHRSADFEAFFADFKGKLQYFFQTEHEVCAMLGNGSLCFEALMYSLFQKGDKIIVANFGKFSERWADYGRLIGLEVIDIQAEWGKAVSNESIFSQMNPNIKAVILTHCETSTGVTQDVEEIAFEVKRLFPDCLILVDGISTIGAAPFYMDAWQVDGAVVSSQKALTNPTGTAFLAMSPLAIEKLLPTHAADAQHLSNYLRYARENSYPYSAPVNLLYGIDAALSVIQQKTLPVVWNEIHHNAKVFRNELEKAGGVLFPENQADVVSIFSFPSVEIDIYRKKLKEKGIILSGGQDRLKGKIARIGHYLPIPAKLLEIIVDF